MNYNSLMNKPTINYRELIGDNSVTEVGGITEEQFNTLLNTDLSSYYTKAQIDDLFSRSYVYREKSGSIVTFDCPASVNGINKVVSEIVAVQSGTGDPSPTNIRPFTGWSAVDVVDTSDNLLGGTALVDAIHATMPSATVDTTEETISFNGSTDTSANKVISGSVVFKPNTQYTFINIGTTGAKGNFRWLYTDGTYDTAVDVVIGAYVSKENKSVKALIKINNSNQNTVLKYNTCGIFEGDLTAEDFAPYNGTTYTTTLKDGQGNPLTCYGGELSNENGVQTLDNTDDIIDLGSINWNYSNGRFVTGRIVDIKAPVNNFTVAKIMCSIYKTVTSSATENPANDFSIGINIYQYICIRDSRYSDPTDFKTAMSGILLKYEKATPQTIPQDNLAIATQEGTNNIWCDTGDITVKALDNIIQG